MGRRREIPSCIRLRPVPGPFGPLAVTARAMLEVDGPTLGDLRGVQGRKLLSMLPIGGPPTAGKHHGRNRCEERGENAPRVSSRRLRLHGSIHASRHPRPRLAPVFAPVERSVGGQGKQHRRALGMLGQGNPRRARQPADHLPRPPCVPRPEESCRSRRKDTPRITIIDEDRVDVAFGGQPAHPAPPSEAVHADVRSVRRAGLEPSGVHAPLERRVCQDRHRGVRRTSVHPLPSSPAVFRPVDALPSHRHK